MGVIFHPTYQERIIIKNIRAGSSAGRATDS
jgi:hypothetical protein